MTALALLLFTLTTGLAGCASQKQYEDPVAVMASSKMPHERLAAAKQSELSHAKDPARITALNKMLWDFGHSDEERQYAIDQLLAYDATYYRQLISRRIVMIRNPQTIRYVCKLAADRKWVEFTPALVRSYARQVPAFDYENRPEVEALASLHPDTPIAQIVFDVFANDDDTVRVQEQVAAWELLCRLTDYAQLVAYLTAAPSTNPMVVDLKASVNDLHCLPSQREGYLRLAWLRNPSRQAFWDASKAAVAKLDESQKKGLELRHLPVLLQLDVQTMSTTREQLISKLDALFDKQDHYLRGPTFDGPMSDYPQRFQQAVDQLCWADLATIDLLFAQLQQPRVAQSLFMQGDKDREDNGSEHGGVITVKENTVSATRYAAMVRQHDYKFIPTDEMIEALYTNLAHYHFHAQRYHNREFAGPGQGDMRLVKQLEAQCLVFTFIDEDTLNIDYYQPNGAVVDIGAIRR